MARSLTEWTMATLVAAGTLAGCAGGQPPVAAAPLSVAPVVHDSAAVAQARADSVRYPYTAADVHFMSGMIAHHAQAIVMAEWALTRSSTPSMHVLAQRIINAQKDEIGRMRQWLADRRQPVPDASPTGMKMTMDGMEHEMLMPGMLSPEQMKALEAARGREFDRMFLESMIRHHRGAVSMVDQLFGSHGAGQDETVFKLASDVQVDQITEIGRMEQMLVALLIEERSR